MCCCFWTYHCICSFISTTAEDNMIVRKNLRAAEKQAVQKRVISHDMVPGIEQCCHSWCYQHTLDSLYSHVQNTFTWPWTIELQWKKKTNCLIFSFIHYCILLTYKLNHILLNSIWRHTWWIIVTTEVYKENKKDEMKWSQGWLKNSSHRWILKG